MSFLKKIKKRLQKLNIKKILYRIYRLFKKRYKVDRRFQPGIPIGAIGTVFGKNRATQIYSYYKLRLKGILDDKSTVDDMPTHSMTFFGGFDHKVCEANIYYEFNPLEKYKGKKVVFHYFNQLTTEQKDELSIRMRTLVDSKFRYDITGYTGFVTRELENIGFETPSWLNEDDDLLFCSEGVQTIYNGDKNVDVPEIQKWEDIGFKISPESDPSHSTPADIYYFMERLHKEEPDIVGRKEVEWIEG